MPTMPVVSDPCSCQRDCLVCGRGGEPTHDCAIHVLLESMVFQERMVHGEPSEARLEEILQNGKEYLTRAMHMTDENSVRWQMMYNHVKRGFPQHHGNCFQNASVVIHSLSVFFKSSHVVQNSPASSTAMVGKDGKLYFRLVDVGALLGRSKVYEFAKIFDNLVVQGKDVLPAHKRYPVMTQRSKLVTPDVVFNILNAELSSLATSFATSLNGGFALVVNPGNLFVESYKTSPVLHVQDSPIPNSVLERKWIQDFIQKVQDIRRIEHGSSLRMVYEAILRAGADIRPSAELAERLALPERIPTLPAQRLAEPERIPTLPAEPERMPTLPAQRLAELERMPTPPAEPERISPAEPERMPTPPAEPERIPPAEPERMPTPPTERPPLERVDPCFCE
ncbi:uncharacterized protein TNIN_127731 [Trichonephila inaurata madagascariensis]|uniref:Uncharacterized protein n=1 Tax=Trichonephila inaurata madagascariensis TaxID=2747483 RepID=A0A8X6K201_9ARAC|nr:uncharacterized protein TNIN_394571 [Trichonephila inaurata madagascariensis]GFY69352.1 uncharacterized protein TNIN_472091 [Trichonephila inaurata madagascariensis]GFY79181.1 uncharacterized protein TNIN_127731 [Trichonephila inaurata madagascariensis]